MSGIIDFIKQTLEEEDSRPVEKIAETIDSSVEAMACELEKLAGNLSALTKTEVVEPVEEQEEVNQEKTAADVAKDVLIDKLLADKNLVEKLLTVTEDQVEQGE